jgi:hypothetical protein
MQATQTRNIHRRPFFVGTFHFYEDPSFHVLLIFCKERNLTAGGRQSIQSTKGKKDKPDKHAQNLVSVQQYLHCAIKSSIYFSQEPQIYSITMEIALILQRNSVEI